MDSLRKSPAHEFSIYGMGGLSRLNYQLSGDGTKSGGIGGGAGIGCTFNISNNWGVVTGVEISLVEAKVAYDNLSGEYEYGNAGTWGHFQFHYSLDDYEEQQKAMLFSVPVMLQFKTGGSTNFYLAGGFKIGFPVSADATISPGTVTTSGDFSYEQVEYIDIEEYGFGHNMPLDKTKSKIDLGFSLALALETGVRFSLSDKIGLYTGLYVDYGLNSISKSDRHLLEYDIDNPSTFKRNSILNTSSIDKVNMLSAGLKVKISFKL
jgi:hypothetical protein